MNSENIDLNGVVCACAYGSRIRSVATVTKRSVSAGDKPVNYGEGRRRGRRRRVGDTLHESRESTTSSKSEGRCYVKDYDVT